MSEFEGQGVQAAIINAGALRLNQDVPADVEVPRRVVEELFGFPMAPILVEVTGKQLKDYLTGSVAYWPGDGMWNQVSGIAFRHDAKTKAVEELTALWEATPRPIACSIAVPSLASPAAAAFGLSSACTEAASIARATHARMSHQTYPEGRPPCHR